MASANEENSVKDIPPLLESEATKENELTDAELQDILSAPATSDPNVAAQDGVQIVDGDGNVINATIDHLLAVGIDPNNMGELTEKQLADLIHIATKDASGGGSTDVATPAAVGPSSTAPSCSTAAQPSTTPSTANDDITMVIGDDGSLRLIDPQQNTYLIPADQLVASGIDVNNMSEDQIQQIVQVAIPNYTGEANAEAQQTTEQRMAHPYENRNEQTSNDHHPPAAKRSKPDTTTSYSDHLPATLKQQQPRKATSQSGSTSEWTYQLIGKRVDVKRAGQRTQAATVRYCRAGAGYKVQFDDGHFEWVQEHQLEIRTGDAGKTAAGEHGNSSTDALTNGVGMAGVGRRIPPAIPGIKVGQQANDTHALRGGGNLIGGQVEPNFCCPICDKKVYQKEPAYIVIRLPACDSCADEKIVVIDQQQEEQETASTTTTATETAEKASTQ